MPERHHVEEDPFFRVTMLAFAVLMPVLAIVLYVVTAIQPPVWITAAVVSSVLSLVAGRYLDRRDVYKRQGRGYEDGRGPGSGYTAVPLPAGAFPDDLPGPGPSGAGRDPGRFGPLCRTGRPELFGHDARPQIQRLTASRGVGPAGRAAAAAG